MNSGSHPISQLRPIVLVLVALGAALRAFAAGEIVGQVSNAKTGQFLEGAEITVVEKAITVLTTRNGEFTIPNLPAGSYTLQASYTGLDPVMRHVTVSDGQHAHETIALTASIYELEPLVVAGVREGNAASLTKQRNANSVMNVVSMDAFGNVADGNIGNFLIRLPGVEGIQEVGDVVGISVRGMPPDLSSVSVDGARSAAAYAEIYTAAGDMGDRAVPIDQLPSDFVKEVQVIKALTPDIPSDSLGGTINLITKSALDVKDNFSSYRAGADINTYRQDQRTWRPAAAYTFLGKLGSSQRLGLAFSTSYTETANGRDRLQMTRNFTDNYTSQARTLNDWADRVRSGVNAKLDYQLSDSVRLTFGASYTYYSFQQPRYDWNITANSTVADFSRVSLAQIMAGAAPASSTGGAAGIAPGYSSRFTQLLNATFADIGSGSARHTRTYKYEAGAEFKWPGEQLLTVRAAYNPSWFATDFQTITATHAGGVGVSVDSRDNFYRPVYAQTYGPTIGYGTDLNTYTATRTDSYNRNNDRMTSLVADYEKTFKTQRADFAFKSGVNYQHEFRDQAPWSPVWNYVGADGVAGPNKTTGINDDNVAQFLQPQPGYGIFNNLYPRRDALDWPSFMRYFNAHTNYFVPNGTTVSAGPQYSRLTEDIGAAYLMGTVNIGKLRVVAGVRAEETQLDTLGTNNDPQNPTQKITTTTGEYKNYFPSIHFRYEPVHDLVARASISTAESRPSYTSLYPSKVVTYNATTGLGTVNEPRPGLKPEFSRNYDLSLEYYNKQAGVLSASYFYKDIGRFLYTETDVIGTGVDNGFGGQYGGFNLVTSANGGSATVKGYELNFMHQFTELPKPFNTLALNSNYTSIETSGNYGTGVFQLIRFVPRSANIGISETYQRFEARISYHRKAGYLYSYSSNPLASVHTSGVHTWDLNLQYKFSRRLTVFADLVNIFNKWESWYTGDDPTRVVMAELYGTRFNAGVSGRF